jgi:hypothetical protein
MQQQELAPKKCGRKALRSENGGNGSCISEGKETREEG